MELHPSGVRWGRRSNLATKAVFNGAAFCTRGALCHVESVKKHNIYTFFFYNLMYVSASTGSSFGRTSRRRQLVVISWGECAVRSLRLTDRAVNQFPRPPQQQINHDILQRSRTSLHHFFFFPNAKLEIFVRRRDCSNLRRIYERANKLFMSAYCCSALTFWLLTRFKLLPSCPVSLWARSWRPPSLWPLFLQWISSRLWLSTPFYFDSFCPSWPFFFSFCAPPTVRHKDRL